MYFTRLCPCDVIHVASKLTLSFIVKIKLCPFKPNHCSSYCEGHVRLVELRIPLQQCSFILHKIHIQQVATGILRYGHSVHGVERGSISKGTKVLARIKVTGVCADTACSFIMPVSVQLTISVYRLQAIQMHTILHIILTITMTLQSVWFELEQC